MMGFTTSVPRSSTAAFLRAGVGGEDDSKQWQPRLTTGLAPSPVHGAGVYPAPIKSVEEGWTHEHFCRG